MKRKPQNTKTTQFLLVVVNVVVNVVYVVVVVVFIVVVDVFAACGF